MKKKNQNLALVKLKNMIKKNSFLIIVLIFIVVIGSFMVLSSSNQKEEILVYGDDVIELHFFHLSTCPHCHAQIAFHNTILARYPNVKIIEYEIKETASKTAYQAFARNHPELNPDGISTPTTVIGNRTNVGYGSDQTTGQTLLSMIEDEQRRINAQWDEATMIRTVDLRLQTESE